MNQPAPAPGGRTVLLVDDEESVRAIGRQMLQKMGYTVVTACDGREALDRFQKAAGAVACVILDLTMPHMDGEETFRELRKLDPGVSVILSSGMHNYPKIVLKKALDMARQNPSSRLGTESEVSAAVVFLLSPAAAYISGEVMRVDGGSSLQKPPLVPPTPHDRNTPWDGFHLRADLPDMLRDPEDRD